MEVEPNLHISIEVEFCTKNKLCAGAVETTLYLEKKEFILPHYYFPNNNNNNNSMIRIINNNNNNNN